MEEGKRYRLGHVGMAVELLRPFATDYAVANELDPEQVSFLEWNDPRPEPDIFDVRRIVYALMAVEDSAEAVYTEGQMDLLKKPEVEVD